MVEAAERLVAMVGQTIHWLYHSPSRNWQSKKPIKLDIIDDFAASPKYAHNGLVAGSSPAGPTPYSLKLYIYYITRCDLRYFKGLGADCRHIPVSVSGHCAVLGPFGASVSGPKNSVPGSRIADARRTRSRGLGDQLGVVQMRLASIICFDVFIARTQIGAARSKSSCLGSTAKNSCRRQRPTRRCLLLFAADRGAREHKGLSCFPTKYPRSCPEGVSTHGGGRFL